MDYASLTAPKGTAGSIANWINYSEAILPLADILLDAQALLISGGVAGAQGAVNPLRVNQMQKTTALAIALGAGSVAQPSDYLAPIILQNLYGKAIRFKDTQTVLGRQTFDMNGVLQTATFPNAYAASGANFIFDFGPNAAISLNLTYYAAPPFLSPTQNTNLLTTNYPHLLRAACLTLAADYLNDDDKFQRNVAKLAAMLNGVNVTDDLDLLGMQSDRTDNLGGSYGW